ncbi:7-carboxy-7-deazaguanine synthase QueE [Marinoscillum furvescens]|uniref:7-carboxy-7-deazaguanine synthase n=1 Tax=Marinoscillum furvescens DSM 4134 TaxID=1122208 RepID=A0A3D9KWI2_MARFU|nr:7-carboxy-7-deazaguanine synthase QueE [Marinoscillum furvescens]RED92633.1 organic radical activating enzyme [Marinoscillum furvescens DSM 4134]
MKISTPKPFTDSLPVMESFLTVQGEGAFSGAAAYFIRLGGCDVGCVWCDVKESWDAAAHPHFTIEEIVAQAKSHGVEIVVITGGEPLMYDLTTLTKALKKAGLRTHVETSGAHAISGDWDWVCFSPKKFMAPKPDFYPAADELKIIVFNKSDFKWAEAHAAECPEKTRLFLQPEWSKKDQMTPLIVDYVKKNPQWRISLQTHKYLDIP